MEELQILLTPNKEHKKVFPNMWIIGFQKGKSLKDFLVRATLSNLTRVEDVNHTEKHLFSLWLYKYCYDLHNRILPGNF